MFLLLQEERSEQLSLSDRGLDELLRNTGSSGKNKRSSSRVNIGLKTKLTNKLKPKSKYEPRLKSMRQKKTELLKKKSSNSFHLLEASGVDCENAHLTSGDEVDFPLTHADMVSGENDELLGEIDHVTLAKTESVLDNVDSTGSYVRNCRLFFLLLL